MRRRAVKLPVLKGNTAVMVLGAIVGATFGLACFGALNNLTRIFAAISTMALPWTYSLYSLIRVSDHNGKPVEIGIGKKPLPALTIVKHVAQRTPLAFPPEPGQCYVCGLPNPDYKEVFGTDTHAACEEWLGPWKPPIWNVYGEKTEKVRNLSAHELRDRYSYMMGAPLYDVRIVRQHLGVLDGWKTPAEVEAWCRDFRVGDKRFTRAERAGYDNFGPTVINLEHLNKEEEC